MQPCAIAFPEFGSAVWYDTDEAEWYYAPLNQFTNGDLSNAAPIEWENWEDAPEDLLTMEAAGIDTSEYIDWTNIF